MKELREKALAALQKDSLLCQGDRIAIGVSGGADSVALLAFLCSIREEYDLTLTVCHLNHCLRGAESDRDEQFVRELAERFSLPVLVKRVEIAALAEETGSSLEAAGREARYAFFQEAAGEDGKIATAHTLDDSIETLLLNLTRGTGLRGLCGIPKRRGNIIRPLLTCTREEILAYLEKEGLSHVEDSSNDGDDYTRNRIRHRVIPELLAINPAASAAMERTMEQLSAHWELTETLADEAQQRLAAQGGGLLRAGVLALPEPIGDRLLLRLLEEAGLPLSARILGEMRRVAEEGGTLDVGRRRWYFTARGNVLQLEERLRWEPPEPCSLPRPLPPKGVYLPLWEGRCLKISQCNNLVRKEPEFFHNYPLKNQVDCDKIKGNIMIRTRRPKDRLRLPGRAGSKPLSKWYAEEGVPAALRDRLLVLADDEGVLWAEPMGADRRCCAGSESQHILTVEVLEERESYENG